jgi:hypothetical protein
VRRDVGDYERRVAKRRIWNGFHDDPLWQADRRPVYSLPVRRGDGRDGSAMGATAALGSLNSFAVVTKAPAAAHSALPLTSNPTNALRPTASALFIFASNPAPLRLLADHKLLHC